MNKIILLTVFICLAQIKWIAATIPSEVWPDARFAVRANSPLDCSHYSHDYEILSSFGFVTYINPLTPASSKTYANMDANENVYYLNVANQASLPSTVFCLKNLQQLYVRSTNFYESGSDDDSVRRLSSEIERVAPSLTYLSVFDTMITHLPEQIGKLTRLFQLQLSNTGLVALPDSIGNLSSLYYLYLDNNKLTSLPTTIANIRTLYYVSLNSNLKLRSVQSLSGLPYLYSLYTNNCPIERLPLNLPNLNNLYMQNNNLTDLIGIGTLGNNTSLNKYFNFYTNHIRFLPLQIRYVRNLYWLDLDVNELATLPTDIFNVTTLRFLYIRNNLFSAPELRAIVAKFNATNPSLNLYWSYMRSSPIESQ